MCKGNGNICKTVRTAKGLTQESASELLSISVESIRAYESGRTAVPCEMIVSMANVYGAPQLLNHYCANECPIGQARGMQTINNRSIEQMAVTLISAFRNAESTKNKLLDVVEDGVITRDEISALNEVVDELSTYAKLREELKILIEKVST